jgi:hypothetical protein
MIVRMSDESLGKSHWPQWTELLHGSASDDSRGGVWRWWEARRVSYNLFVGLVGFVTWWLVLIAGSAAVKPGVDFEEPLVKIVGPPVYAVLANICYTLGPVLDFLRGSREPSKKLFGAGLFFSLALTALPGIWAVYCWIHSVVTDQKMD